MDERLVVLALGGEVKDSCLRRLLTAFLIWDGGVFDTLDRISVGSVSSFLQDHVKFFLSGGDWSQVSFKFPDKRKLRIRAHPLRRLATLSVLDPQSRRATRSSDKTSAEATF